MALVEQLDAGKGYTLLGHSILETPWMIREQYSGRLFFHPPGGPALFWFFHRVFGSAGYALVQVFSFVVFFWSTILLVWSVGAGTRTTGPIAALLATFTPIMAQVAGRLWLDGPMLAFATAAAATFVATCARESRRLLWISAVLLGFACLIKLTALLVVPGAFALALSVAKPGVGRTLVTRLAAWAGIAAAMYLPWAMWQWSVMGTPFPGWAGRPAPRLVQTNQYVHYLTVVRSPWIYLTLLPRVLWTLVPALLLWITQLRTVTLRRRGTAAVLWIAVVIAAHVYLGSTGYSKLLRYVILVTPAAIVLFALAVDEAIAALRDGRWIARSRVITLVLLTVAAIGMGLEVAQGLKTALHDNASLDLIVPLMGQQ